MSTLKLDTIQHPDAAGAALTFDSDGTVTASGALAANSLTAGGSSVLTSTSDSSEFPSAILTRAITLSQLPSGSLMQTVRGNDVETSNITYSGTYSEVNSNLRTTITTVTANPYIEVYWVLNVEADGDTEDRIAGRMFVSTNGGSYTQFGLTHFLGNMNPSSGQEDGGTFLWTGTVSCSAGDTLIFTPYVRSESGFNMPIQFGQDIMSSDFENRVIVKEYKA
jgi:hypothetical protein